MTEQSPPYALSDNRRLLPAESMALTVGLAQVQRGEEPSPNVAVICVYALARLVDRYDYTEAS